MTVFDGELVAIFIAAEHGAAMRSVERAAAQAGQGLVGDRHCRANITPKPHGDVTLIEEEAIAAAAHDYDLALQACHSRRNLVTRGIALNHFAHCTFRVGNVLIEGLELCEPCGHLEKLTLPGVRKALIHRGGLRARIVEGGTLTVGDRVRPVE